MLSHRVRFSPRRRRTESEPGRPADTRASEPEPEPGGETQTAQLGSDQHDGGGQRPHLGAHVLQLPQRTNQEHGAETTQQTTQLRHQGATLRRLKPGGVLVLVRTWPERRCFPRCRGRRTRGVRSPGSTAGRSPGGDNTAVTMEIYYSRTEHGHKTHLNTALYNFLILIETLKRN